jgi:hypothetical protein
MSIGEIVRQIDADLSRLQEARALLAQSEDTSKRRKTTSHPGPGKVAKSSPNGRNSGGPVRRRGVRNRRTGGFVARAGSLQNPTAVSAPQAELPRTQVPKVSESLTRRNWRTSENRFASCTRHPSPERRRPANSQDVEKAAIALGGQIPSGVVVVSPVDAQRARDRSVKSEQSHRLVANSSRSGKAAFEALFRDKTAPLGSRSG